VLSPHPYPLPKGEGVTCEFLARDKKTIALVFDVISIRDENRHADHPSPAERAPKLRGKYWLIIIISAIVLAFALYINGLSKNPPGFYVDESGIAYNAFLIAHTGKGEFGQRFPLFFQFYTNGWTEWANPTQIYLLAIPFRFFRPSIHLARIYGAFWVFLACLLLGFLAKQISGRRIVAVLVALLALVTPWLFEVSRLVFETFFYPAALTLFLLSVYFAQRKQKWSWFNVGMLAATLMLLTYSYTIGRLLGPLLAFSLLLFLTSWKRLIAIAKTWVIYGVTLIPLLIFKLKHPEVLTQRFYSVSYIKPDSHWREIVPKFFRRYLEDFSVVSLLIDGDGNPRHHVPGSLGSFLFGVFVLSIIGLVVVFVCYWRDPWWRFVVFGTLVSIVPGALTADQFHSLRLIAYPVFLLVLTIPALQYLLGRQSRAIESPQSNETFGLLIESRSRSLPALARRVTLLVLLAATAAQALYFQRIFRREGPKREWVFDADYKAVYDAAIALPNRPIYLIDGSSPAYVHAYWYATVEGRDRAQFVHLEDESAPYGAIVISSAQNCDDCEVIKKSGEYIVYRARWPTVTVPLRKRK